MRLFPSLPRSARVFHHSPTLSKALLIFVVSGGGLLAYSESKSDHGADNEFPEVGTKKKKKVVVLGTGWAGTSFLKSVDSSLYDVKVVSPLNYFAFTPLLPSVTCGTVEARSIVEPIRKIVEKKIGEIQFWEAECVKIDTASKRVHCRCNNYLTIEEEKDFFVEYDYLVIAVGAQANTFNTPGVMEHCHFLKEIEDAQRIRRSVIDCFETASLPNLSEDERKKALHFVVVGGGPTGVEFAAELHDFICEDLLKIYPTARDLLSNVPDLLKHFLLRFDERISAFAEGKFQRDGIEVKTGQRVVSVSDKAISTKAKSDGQVASMPYRMVVWSTGIGTRPIILDFMQQIGQGGDPVGLASRDQP
ncbi:External alternative NAD(P)H-ubiquinone oxidoreductase B1, mitochondrial [Asimina triloba]